RVFAFICGKPFGHCRCSLLGNVVCVNPPSSSPCKSFCSSSNRPFFDLELNVQWPDTSGLHPCGSRIFMKQSQWRLLFALCIGSALLKCVGNTHASGAA